MCGTQTRGKTTGATVGSCPLTRSLFVHAPPRARSSHECHIPDRVITVHHTRSTPSSSHTAHARVNTCTDVRHTPAGPNKLCAPLSFPLTLVLPFIRGQNNNNPSLTHPKPQFGLSMKECQKEFPDTSQTANQLPGWANDANSTFTGGKIDGSGTPARVRVPAAQCRRRASESRRSVAPFLPSSPLRRSCTENTCSCHPSSAMSSKIRATT